MSLIVLWGGFVSCCLSALLSVGDFTPGPYEVTFPAGQTTQMLNISITNDELFEADTNDFYVFIDNFASNCSIRTSSINEVQVQILDEDSTLCVPVNTVISKFLVPIAHCTHCDHSRDNSIGWLESHVNSNGVIMHETSQF